MRDTERYREELRLLVETFEKVLSKEEIRKRFQFTPLKLTPYDYLDQYSSLPICGIEVLILKMKSALKGKRLMDKKDHANG